MGWHAVKRWLYLIHRWIGIATCLLFVMWFASGLVMLYVPFPSLERDEEFQGLAPIAWERVVQLPQAEEPLRQLTLEMRGDRPIWRLSPWDAPPSSVWADSGTPAGSAGREEARAIAASFGDAPVTAMRMIHADQWTVGSGYDWHRPLWKAELAGEGGRVLYVSSRTGQVVLDTAQTERFWNWLGSVPHWLYPRALRADQPLWRQVVMWVSGPCILVALTGIWIGLMRIRPGARRFKGGRMTPYRGWMKWHHVSGLVGSAFLMLWIFSGWLSVDPFRLFASEGISAPARQSYAGASVEVPDNLIALADRSEGATRLVVQAAAGSSFLRVQKHGSEDIVLAADTLAPHRVDMALVQEKLSALFPGAAILSVETLTRPDAYWYAVRSEVHLPVLRVKYDDDAKSWVHIDPATGEILGHSDSRRRIYRWLFDLFHRWDLNLLLHSPPARVLLIWLMSIAGLISSATAVYVGWRRLRRTRAS